MLCITVCRRQPQGRTCTEGRVLIRYIIFLLASAKSIARCYQTKLKSPINLQP